MQQAQSNYSSLTSGASPAFRVLLQSCRLLLETSTLDALQTEIDSLAQNDWEEVEKLATVHRIRPILYNALSRIKGVDPALMQSLKSASLGITHKAFEGKILSNELVANAAAEGIHLRSYKGTDFSQVVYGDLGLREFTDLDFIVPEQQVPQLMQFLERNNAEIEGADFYKSNPGQYIARQKDIVCRLRDRTKKYSFEFHYKPAPAYLNAQLDFKQMGIEENDQTISPAAYLHIMTLNHGMVDHYPGLRELMDLAMLVRKEPNVKRIEVLSDYYVLNEQLVSLFFGVQQNGSVIPVNKKANEIAQAIVNRSARARIKTITILRTALAARKGITAKRNLLSSILRFFLVAGPQDHNKSENSSAFKNTVSRIFRLIRVYKRHV